MGITDGLISSYSFEGNSNDSVSSNNGTPTDVSYTEDAGKITLGGAFNGETSRVAITENAELKPTNITIAFWAKVTDLMGGFPIAVSRFDESGYRVFMNGSSGEMRFSVWTSDFNPPLVSITPVTPGEEHLWMFTYDGTTLNMYLDNALDNTSSVSNPGNIGYAVPTNLGIGNTAAVTGNTSFYGGLDIVTIWDHALDSTDRDTFWNDGEGMQFDSPPPTTATNTSVLFNFI